MEISITVEGEFVMLKVGADIFGLTPDMATRIGIAMTTAAQKVRKDWGTGK